MLLLFPNGNRREELKYRLRWLLLNRIDYESNWEWFW